MRELLGLKRYILTKQLELLIWLKFHEILIPSMQLLGRKIEKLGILQEMERIQGFIKVQMRVKAGS